jgi:hypothetical protein
VDFQKVELGLIADDALDLLQLMLDIRTHEASGYLALALSPLIGFVSEESHKYLIKQGLLTDDPALFKSFDLAITKLRALLKLFDDTDGGKEGLVKNLELFQRKSAQWMDVGKKRWQRIVGKSLQPDLGIYFINNELLYPSIVGFSTSGLTRQQIENLKDEDFAGLSQNTFDFSRAVGGFLTKTIGVVGKHIALQSNLEASRLDLKFPITHNDFFSKQIYTEVAKCAQLMKSEDAIVLLYVLSQVNVAHILLPQVLSPQSNLLFRLRFLMAYHATSALAKLPTNTNSGLAALLEAIQSLPDLPNERKVRNVLAHYGFGEGRKFLVTSDSSLDQIVKGFSGQDRSFVENLILQRLALISDWTRANLSKQSLAKFRAILGDHT